MPFNEEIFQNGQFKRLKSNTMSRKFYGKDKSQRLLTQCSYKSKLPKAPVIFLGEGYEEYLSVDDGIHLSITL